MSDGARTRDILDHNQVLYLLSYTHHAAAAERLGRAASVYRRPRLPREPRVAAACASSDVGPGGATNSVRPVVGELLDALADVGEGAVREALRGWDW